jgi:hypothetical protein
MSHNCLSSLNLSSLQMIVYRLICDDMLVGSHVMNRGNNKK